MNPPLPEPVPFMAAQGQHVYTEAQLLAYRDACIEMCARKVEERMAQGYQPCIPSEIIRDLK